MGFLTGLIGGTIGKLGGLGTIFQKGDGKLFNLKGTPTPSGGGQAAPAPAGGGLFSNLSGSIGFGKAQGNYMIPLLIAVAIAVAIAFRGFFFGTRKRRR